MPGCDTQVGMEMAPQGFGLMYEGPVFHVDFKELRCCMLLFVFNVDLNSPLIPL